MARKFWFKHADWGEEWQLYGCEEHSAADAAVQIAENHWSEDPHDPSQFEFNVQIKDERSVVKRFTVTAEVTVNFHARELAMEPPDDQL